MTRFHRRKFDFGDLDALGSQDAKTRLLFDWWCDEKDRESYLTHLNGKVDWIHSRALVEDDPAPPRTPPPNQGHARVALISHADDVADVLADRNKEYSNIPYAELGGASFMLALDPGARPNTGGVDWHAQQRAVASAVLDAFSWTQLESAAALAVEQAALVSLRSSTFDVAEFAAQAALRYFGLVFGYSGADHGLLEDAAHRGYRALQYLIVGRHFLSEPGTLPAAQQALGRLASRTAALMDEYASLARSPRKPLRPWEPRSGVTWPAGVQPWDELGLASLDQPVLRRLPGAAQQLSGHDLCNLVAGLLVGMVGNVQTSISLIVQDLLGDPAAFTHLRTHGIHLPQLSALVAKHPPVPFLPRRTLQAVTVRGEDIPAGTDCILALRPSRNPGCPWGEGDGRALHACLGRAFTEPLLLTILRKVASLPNLERRLDNLTGEVLDAERLWGFGCSRYRVRYRRDKVRVQQPLIVVMPIRSPVAENAERLRRVIRSAAPRIEWLLQDSRMVHVAWFEFMEHDTQLALRTVYDGDFDSYIQHFALRAGELFDQLFECIEGGPPLPVAEHPNEFVETIRRYNRTPLGGYFYCAYPDRPVSQIVVASRKGP